MTVIEAFYWIGLAGAAAAVVIYFVQIALRPQAVRLINGAGLFFTGVALGEMAILLRQLPASGRFGGGLVIVALLAAVYFQGAASLRRRKGDRRGERVEDRRGQAEAASATAG